MEGFTHVEDLVYFDDHHHLYTSSSGRPVGCMSILLKQHLNTHKQQLRNAGLANHTHAPVQRQPNIVTRALLQAVPSIATAPVLVLVGAMMIGEAGHINWSSIPTALPAFLTIVIQPFTFSIANGIYSGA
jgi:hypothetical protein